MPKLFRMTEGGKLMEDLFEGSTINTPSMLCVEDALDGLAWAESVGGLQGLMTRTKANLATVERWVKDSNECLLTGRSENTCHQVALCRSATIMEY